MEKERKRSKKFKRLPIEQHRELLLDPMYNHKVHADKKAKLYRQQEQEYEKDLKEFLNGKN